MTTLRRDLRKKIQERLDAYLEERNGIIDWGTIYDIAADAALEVRGMNFKPQTVEQAIFAGVPVTEEVAERENIRDIAPKKFEQALGFTKALPWWSSKEWTEFGEWVCERHTESNTIFGEYNIWRNTPYTKGGMSNVRIRGFIKEFYDSWDMFMMSRKPKTDEDRPEYKPYVDPREGLVFAPPPPRKK